MAAGEFVQKCFNGSLRYHDCFAVVHVQPTIVFAMA
jgi:hypothetical protein